MKLIVGLGNPGKEYENTKHNVGFKVVETLIMNEKFIASSLFVHTGDTLNPVFKLDKLYQAEIAKGKIENEEVVLVKPQTFMNNSGASVKKLVDTHHISSMSDIIVIHDDITIDFGKIKVSHEGGAGNHNGVQSIMNHLGNSEFIRVRLGIGRGAGILQDVVLSRFKPEEIQTVQEMIKHASEACYTIVEDGVERAMNRFN